MDTNYIGWEAVYKDESTLNQFGRDGEKLFRDIDQEQLKEFRLHYKGRTVSVFLDFGILSINGLLLQTNVSGIEGAAYRLINFVRRTKSISTGMETQDLPDEYFVGFQVTIDGTNHKRMVSIKDYFIRLVEE